MNCLRGKAVGARVAILGSGPSAHEFAELEDIVIAVNGAALLPLQYSHFMAGDVSSPWRDWWLAADGAACVRMVSSYIAPFDPYLYPDADSRAEMQAKFFSFCEQVPGPIAYTSFVPEHAPAKPHSFFCFGGFGLDFVERISPEQNAMYWGGTISAIALQAALIMGAQDINIYGCSFDNDKGDAYAYRCPQNQLGATTEEQARVMAATIKRVREFGRNVTIHGPSRLHDLC